MKQLGMKEIKKKEQSAKDLVTKSDFKGYTIEEIRFQRALVAMEAEFCKAKCLRSWNNLVKDNPLSPTKNSFTGKAGSVALKMINGLNYLDYIMLGLSFFTGARKLFSFFRKVKRK